MPPSSNAATTAMITASVVERLPLEDVVVVPERGALTGLSIEEMESRAKGRFFVLQLNRQGGDTITNPDRSLTVKGGDGVVIFTRAELVAYARDHSLLD